MKADSMSDQRNRKRDRIVVRADPAARRGMPTVWLVGPWSEGEFAVVRGAIDPGATWLALPRLGDAISAVATPPAPEVVLVAQPWPGVDEQEVVDRLQAAAPLVRIVVVAGSWCEGELRTGRPLTGVTRIYWHELPAWWRRAVAERDAGFAPHWAGAASVHWRSGGEETRGRGTVAVDAVDFVVFETLEAALRLFGWKCVWAPRGRGEVGDAVAGIWDGGQLDAEERVALAAFCDRLTRAGLGAKPQAVMAIVDFPRGEHVELASRLGASVVMGKPYRVDALADELARLVAGQPHSSLARSASP
jgi:hypothetical protein